MTALRIWSRLALAGLVLSVLASFWAAAAYIHQLLLVDQMMEDPGSVTPSEGDASDHVINSISIASLVLLLLTAAAFMGWMFIAAKVAQRIRPDALRFGPGWAIGGWFVPILWWWRPPQVVNDVWGAGGPLDQRTARSPLVGWWWAAWLALNTAAEFARGLLGGETTLDALRDETVVDIAGELLNVVAGALAICVVTITTSRLLRQPSRVAATANRGHSPEPSRSHPSEPPVAESPDWNSDPDLDERWERWNRHQ